MASLEKDAALVSQFEEVQEVLQIHVERISQLLRSLCVMHGHGLVKKDQLPTTAKVASLNKKIALLQKRLQESRTQLKAGNTWASCDKEAGEMAKALEEFLNANWNQFVSSHIRNIDAFYPFHYMEGCATILVQLDALTRQLKNLMGILPKAEGDVAAVLKASAQMDLLIAKLDLDQVPSVIQEFLKKATKGAVSLADLTDEILRYLRAKNFASSFRVILGSGNGRQS